MQRYPGSHDSSETLCHILAPSASACRSEQTVWFRERGCRTRDYRFGDTGVAAGELAKNMPFEKSE